MSNAVEKEILIKEYEHHIKVLDEAVSFGINLMRYLSFIIVTSIVSLAITSDLNEQYYYLILISLIILLTIVGFFSATHMIVALYAQLCLALIEKKLKIEKGYHNTELADYNQKKVFWLRIPSKFFNCSFKSYWLFASFIIIITFGLGIGLLISWLIKSYWEVSWIIRGAIFIPLTTLLYALFMRFIIIFQIKTFPPALINIINEYEKE